MSKSKENKAELVANQTLDESMHDWSITGIRLAKTPKGEKVK